MLKLLIIESLLLGFTSALVPHLEVSKLLNEIADHYNPPLVISFLRETIGEKIEMIEKVKLSFTDLEQSRKDNFDLGLQSLRILDKQLIDHENADYFDHNGTQKVKEFIGRFTMIDEMIPINLDSEGPDKVTYTAEFLISLLNITNNERLINATNYLIAQYINDMTDKETNENSSRLQKLSASLASMKLQKLVNLTYSEPYSERKCQKHACYYESEYTHEIVDKRSYELEKVLRQVANIVNLFYSKFVYLTDGVRKHHGNIIETVQTVSPP